MSMHAGTLTAAVGLAVGCVGVALAYPERQIADSSIGKSPYQVMTGISGGMGTRGLQGKSPQVIWSEGPPPRGRSAPPADVVATHFFYLYADRNAWLNHFQPTGYMGDRQDVRTDTDSREDPANGPTCVKITYSPTEASAQGWAGVYWLDPQSNWGYKRGGYNLTGMTRLTFWARGAKGGEKIALFKVGGISGPYADSGDASVGPIWLTRQWQQYVIDLHDVDLAKISGGFAWSANAGDNVGAVTFYLDEIRYER